MLIKAVHLILILKKGRNHLIRGREENTQARRLEKKGWVSYMNEATHRVP